MEDKYMKYLYQRCDGTITKYAQIEDNIYLDTNTALNINKDEVLLLGKVSEDITDLIEVGDIVELVDVLSQEVIYIWDKEMLEAVKQDIEEGQTLKSILTKEEFMNRKYKI